MKILGLTGGIGSGKTTVAGFFTELGIPVYIADDEAKNLMNTDLDVRNQILTTFGASAYTQGVLDRKYLAGQVFTDPEKLHSLNSIVHPAVGRAFEQWKKDQQASYVVYEAAILFEKGGYKKCDRILLITAPREERIRRIKARDNSNLEEISARMEQQWPDEKKEELADFVVVNTDLATTQSEVKKIHQAMLHLA